MVRKTMDKLWKKLGLPLCIIIVGTLLRQFINSISFTYDEIVKEIAFLGCLFLFGMSLNQHKKKKSSNWIGKLIICFIVVTLFVYRLGYFNPASIFPLLGILGLTNQTMAIPMVLVLCGYLFFD